MKELMVACDNSSCEKQWFYFDCVGLSNTPEGHWFCSSLCANHY